MGYKIFYQGEKVSFNEDLIKSLGIKSNSLYEIVYTSGAEHNPQREERHSLGKNILSYLDLIKNPIFGEITLRGPVIIIGENQ